VPISSEGLLNWRSWTYADPRTSFEGAVKCLIRNRNDRFTWNIIKRKGRSLDSFFKVV